MDYVGEHLMPGKLGHFFSVLSFAASFVAVVAFYKSTNAKTREEADSWRKMARIAFGIDVLGVFAVLGTIVYIVCSHLWEYNFAWEHSNLAMPLKYTLSCIWEAQEGSFLLWNIWVSVLGLILIKKAGKWESPVMTVMSFANWALSTMLIGIYIFGNKVGINAFILVREKMAGAPIFQRADYLNIPQMKDGQGLNALLQNYWMTIHPPILFLGFASTIVPFAYAIAGLWKKQFGDWTRVALPWTLFSACLLGLGIMMGAAWAYEALSFAGYWSWDPVENASLVPWLVMVAGLHTMVVYNATGHSLRATHFFLITQFILILYSTFLTRSGILGDESVHAFVDSGMNVQLSMFVFVFLIPAYVLFIVRYKKIPHIAKEEATSSREFWMFIGSLVLFLSGVFIICGTSLPVFNLVTGRKFTMGDDKTFAYNRIEIFVAILLGLFTAFAQFLKYKTTSKAWIVKKLLLPTAISVVLAVVASIFGGIHYDHYGIGFLVAIHLALFTAIYAVVANAAFIWTGLKGSLRAAGASIAHVGFGLMLVGILISSAKKELLSHNTTGINIFTPESGQDPAENITLIKGIRTDMGKYYATYVSNDSVDSKNKKTWYDIYFEKKDSTERFHLYPDLMKATKGMDGIAANPAKYHYWDRDVFVYINAADNPEAARNDTSQFKLNPISVGDTIFYSKGVIILDTVIVNPDNARAHFKDGDTALMARLTVISKDSMRYTAMPYFYLKNNQLFNVNDTVFAQDLALSFAKVGENRKIEIGVKESSSMVPFVAMKAIEFPQINVLWIGTIIMIIGFIMSMVWRIRQVRDKVRGLPLRG